VCIAGYEGVEHMLDDALRAGEEVFSRHVGVGYISSSSYKSRAVAECNILDRYNKAVKCQCVVPSIQ
jgi:hypothetical protein